MISQVDLLYIRPGDRIQYKREKRRRIVRRVKVAEGTVTFRWNGTSLRTTNLAHVTPDFDLPHRKKAVGKLCRCPDCGGGGMDAQGVGCHRCGEQGWVYVCRRCGEPGYGAGRGPRAMVCERGTGRRGCYVSAMPWACCWQCALGLATLQR